MIRIILVFLFLPVISFGQGLQGGGGHSAILCSDSVVYASGNNDFGQLGNSANASTNSFVNTGLTGIVQIATGNDFTLALKSNGTVWAWGNNKFGQLGNGTTVDANEPFQIANLTNVLSIGAGEHTSYAVLSNGNVFAWGRNNAGQVGGSTATVLNPIKVQGVSSVKSISAGQSFVMALTFAGDVYAWGANKYGQLGLGDYQDKKVPTKIASFSQVDKIVSGRYFTLALKAGNVYAWGDNGFGSLGLGDKIKRNTPTQINSLVDIKEISVGNSHALALSTSGNCYAWGFNFYNQLGNNSTVDVDAPVQLSFVNPITTIGAGKNHCFAFDNQGLAYAWGYNAFGQIGLTAGANVLLPTVTALPCTPALFQNACNSVAQISSVNNSYCIGETVVLQSASINASTYKWVLNGNVISNTSTFNYVFNSAGANAIQLIVNPTACENSTNATINIAADPIASFGLTQSLDSIYLSNTSSDALTYSWDFGDGTTSVELNPVYVYQSPGTYTVSLVAINNCNNDTSAQDVTFTITGFPLKEKTLALSVYPNPTSNSFSVINSTKKSTVKMFDATGKLVLTKENVIGNTPINIANFPDGVYTVKIDDGKRTVGKELVVRK